MVAAPIAYLVSQYPALSHTFIEREVLGLRELGLDVTTFSVRRPPESLPSETMRREAESTISVLADKPRILRDNVTTVLRSPTGYLRALRRAARTGSRHARNRLWQVFYFGEANRIYQEMRQRGLRHIHAHFANNGADVARLVAELGRSVDGPDSEWAWSFTMHGPTELEAVAHYDLAAKVLSAAGVACISDFTRSQLMRMVDPGHWDKLRLVRMSVDIDRFPPPQDDRDHPGPLRILNVGRLVPEKGAPLLVDAVAQMTRAGISCEARLIGDGPLRPLLEAQIAEAGLSDRVTLVGPVGQDEILPHYHWADVFCLPSFQEGLPVVLMEAMSTGLPVVTTRIAGIGELVVDGVNGRLLTPGRSDLVADALTDLTKNGEGRKRLGDAGREAVAAEFSMSCQARRQFEFLQDVRRDSASSS